MSLAGLQCRYASESDAKTLHAFAQRTFEAAFAADNTPSDMRAYLATMTLQTQLAAITDQRGRVIVLEHNDNLVAYATVRMRPSPDCVTVTLAAELHRFYVDAEWQGRQVAQSLMQQVYVAATELGAQYVWLGVWEHNPRAIRFYEKEGFSDVGSVDFVLGTAEQTDRVMQRQLTAMT